MNDICPAADGGFAAVGGTASSGTLAGSGALFVVRTDAEGGTLWTRTFTGIGSAHGNAIAATADGGFAVTGQTHALPGGDSKVLLLKIDADGSPQWEKHYDGGSGTWGSAVATTRDGGYIVCGGINPENGQSFLNIDLYLLRIDPAGERVWERRIDNGALDSGSAVTETGDGGFVIAGASSDGGNSDMCLIGTDPSGTVLWRENLGDEDFDTGEGLAYLPGEGYVVVGTVVSPIDRTRPEVSLRRSAVYMVRTDLSGKPLWKRHLGEPENDLLGHGVERAGDGGLVVTGQTSSGSGATRQFLLRTDRDGQPIWNVTVQSDADEIARAVIRTTDGGYVTVADRPGRLASRADGSGVITRFGPDGGSPGAPLIGTIAVHSTPEPSATPALPPPAVLWEQTYRLGFSCTATDLSATRDGGFVVAGSTIATSTTDLVGPPFPQDAFLLRVDASGAVLWNRTYGGSDGDGANAVRETADGGFIVAGYTSAPGDHNAEMYLVRTDRDGKVIWEHAFGGDGYDVLNGVAEAADGGFVIAGQSDIDGSSRNRSVYLAKTDRNGTVLWERSVPNDYPAGALSLEPIGDGDYIVGTSGDPNLLRIGRTGDLRWTQNLKGPLNYASPTRDGGIIVAGTVGSRETGHLMMNLVRVNATGGIEWERLCSPAMGIGYDAKETEDGGVIAVGTNHTIATRTSPKDPLPVTSGAYIIRTDSDGRVIWETTLEPDRLIGGIRVLQARDKGYLVLGNGGDAQGDVALSSTNYMGWVRLVKLGAEKDDRGFPLIWFLLPIAAVVMVLAVLRVRRS
ncbi:MAG TPA: hypothetical protein HA263_10650 [Methanoregulaceae archaeon]|nr:hypothetical protein [Methanoregulaceae archaeon]